MPRRTVTASIAGISGLKVGMLIIAVLLLSACGGGGSSGNPTDNRESNSLPGLQFDDGDVLGGGNTVIRIPASDDTGIVRVGNSIIRQGNLSECSAVLADESLTANSLIEACLLDQPSCAVSFQPVGDQIEVIPPPLFAPIGLEFDLTLVDRDGSATAPVRAVFCFDVGVNAPPVTSPDVFQLNYPSRISRQGVRYNDRCEKAVGSEGVLANDEDDEHVTNTCLTAELLELPTYASNRATFGSTFGADGSFVYEAFNEIPPENSSGLSIDTFTYQVTDGINPVSEPVVVEVVFADSVNAAPVAADDSFTVAEDSEVEQFSVLDNDFDPDALPLNISGINNGPGNGVANIRNGRLIEYRPRAGFVGQDQFTYTVVDSGGLTATAVVTITVTNTNDAPIAQNDAATTNENTPVVVQVLANDSDIENDELSIVSVGRALNGNATGNADGTITYTPDTGYSGSDAFEYTITDGEDTATATVVLTVVFVNVDPVIGADQFSVAEGSSRVLNLLGNDTDGDNDVLTIVDVSDPSNGVATILANGNVRYTPNEGFSGSDSFNYTVSDGTVEVTGQVLITINLVNDAPLASNDSASTDEDTVVVIDVLSNDNDPDGDTLTVTSVSNVRSGSATINADNTVTFVPNDGFSGQAGFSYVIDDGNGATDSAAVTILVSDTNASPVAVDDVRSTEENDPVVIAVLQNDSDPDEDPLTLSVLTQPSNGTARVSARGDVIVYSPSQGFSGTDSFTYQISDGNGAVADATVTVTVSSVNAVPTAVSDSARVSQGEAINIAVLANDTDPDGDDLTVSIDTSPDNGAVRVLTNNSILYTADETFSGEDTFVYAIADGNGGTATATVTVTVEQVIVNNPPVAVDDITLATQGQAVNFNVLANDSDPDGDNLTVTVTTPPDNGVATVLSNNQIRYTPSARFTGRDNIGYTVSDGNGATATAVVAITVQSSNVAPVAEDDIATTAQGQLVSIDVIDNDSDVNTDTLSITSVSAAANGSTDIVAGEVTYTPAPGFSGTDTFTYVVSDGNGGEDSATVTVTVVVVNLPPVAEDDSAVTAEATAVNIDVLANDTDDGDQLTVSIVTGPANGSAVVAADNSISYEPEPGFSGTDSFVYELDDGSATDLATVSITVTAVVVNQAPDAVDDTATTDQDQAVSIPVLANDSDPDGVVIAIDTITTPLNGVVVADSAGVLTYTPDTGFSGEDSFSYSITDSDGATASATVTVTVNEVVAPITNALPVAVDDAAVTEQDTAVTIAVLDNDIDDDALTVSALNDGSNGTTVLNADGSIDYLPEVGFTGEDSFDYTVDDGISGSATATVTVTVNPVLQ